MKLEIIALLICTIMGRTLKTRKTRETSSERLRRIEAAVAEIDRTWVDRKNRT
jgi:hypothetical protein